MEKKIFMQDIFKEAIDINLMEDSPEKALAASQLFSKINARGMPEEFNWATQIFEGIHVAAAPGKTALLWQDLDQPAVRHTYSYQDVSDEANRLLNFLRLYGIDKGDNVYIMAPVRPETWFAGLACIKGGIISVPTATTMTVRALQFRFEVYPPTAIIADEASAVLVDEALSLSGPDACVKIVLGKRENWLSISDIQNQDEQAQGAKTGADEPLFCFFTSGTTGLPKRVGHTVTSYPVGHLSTTLMIGLRPDDIHANLSAPGWAKWSWSSFFSVFNAGATAAGFSYTSLDAERYLYAVEQNRVTSMCASPTAWRLFIDLDPQNFDLSGLRQSLSAGEPLSPHIIDKWNTFCGHRIRSYYGQTETTAMIGNSPWMALDMKNGSMGRPLEMYDIALADPEGRLIDRPGEVGHIVVKLDKWRPVGLFSEYMGNPEKMSAVFVGQYYYTGDRALFDEDGLWWFDGRADDVIKSSDYRIGPFEVESALAEHPAVAEVAVVGAPDPKRYQLVKAYITLAPNYTGSKELACELFRHTMHILPKFKIPRIMEFVSEVPKTMSGKIRRVDLRKSVTNRPQKVPSDSEELITEYFYWDFPELNSKNI